MPTLESPFARGSRRGFASVEEREAGAAVSKWFDQVLFFILSALLIFGPLAFGAVEEWSELVLQVGAVVLLWIWAFREATMRQLFLPAFSLLQPLLLFFALAITQLALRTTAYPFATFNELMKDVVYGIFFLVAAHCFRTEKRLRWFALTFTIFGFLLALFSIIQSLTGTDKLYWLRAPHEESVAIFGPYVNRNHYAGIMELLTPVAMGIALHEKVSSPKRMLAAFAGIVMAASIVLSLSRGGMVAMLVEILFLVMVVYGVNRSARTTLMLLLFFVATLGFLAWLNGAGVIDRIETVSTEWKTDITGGRSAMARDTIHMFRQRPIAGWGLGTFASVYPQYRTFFTNLYIDHAHNDYVEVLAETGVLGLGAMLWFVVQLYRKGLGKIQRQGGTWQSAMTLAALTGCTGFLVHGFSDFNFHIPANAAMFFAFAALAGASARDQGERAGAGRIEKWPDRPLP